MINRKRLILVVPAWVGLVSAIALQRLFVDPGLTWLDWALIFAASIFAGLVAGDLETAVVGFAGTVFFAGVVIGGVLALPVTLGLTGPLWEQVAEIGAVVEVVQTLFPFTLVIVLTGGIIGAMLAERLDLN